MTQTILYVQIAKSKFEIFQKYRFFLKYSYSRSSERKNQLDKEPEPLLTEPLINLDQLVESSYHLQLTNKFSYLDDNQPYLRQFPLQLPYILHPNQPKLLGEPNYRET